MLNSLLQTHAISCNVNRPTASLLPFVVFGDISLLVPLDLLLCRVKLGSDRIVQVLPRLDNLFTRMSIDDFWSS